MKYRFSSSPRESSLHSDACLPSSTTKPKHRNEHALQTKKIIARPVKSSTTGGRGGSHKNPELKIILMERGFKEDRVRKGTYVDCLKERYCGSDLEDEHPGDPPVDTAAHNAFFLYRMDPDVKAKHHSSCEAQQQSSIVQAMAREWNAMGSAERLPYERKADQLRYEYNRARSRKLRLTQDASSSSVRTPSSIADDTCAHDTRITDLSATELGPIDYNLNSFKPNTRGQDITTATNSSLGIVALGDSTSSYDAGASLSNWPLVGGLTSNSYSTDCQQLLRPYDYTRRIDAVYTAPIAGIRSAAQYDCYWDPNFISLPSSESIGNYSNSSVMRPVACSPYQDFSYDQSTCLLPNYPYM